MGSLECLYSLDSIRAALGFAGSRPLLLEVSTAISYLNNMLSPPQEAGLEMELDATNFFKWYCRWVGQTNPNRLPGRSRLFW